MGVADRAQLFAQENKHKLLGNWGCGSSLLRAVLMFKTTDVASVSSRCVLYANFRQNETRACCISTVFWVKLPVDSIQQRIRSSTHNQGLDRDVIERLSFYDYDSDNWFVNYK